MSQNDLGYWRITRPQQGYIEPIESFEEALYIPGTVCKLFIHLKRLSIFVSDGSS